MDPTYLSLITFVILTALYYCMPSIGKLPIPLNPDQFAMYPRANMPRLALYLGAVVVVQFGINAAYVATKCGGSVGRNIGAAMLITFIPWVLLFGLTVLALTVWPGLKSAFSDVVGYYVVAGSASTLLAELLFDTKVQDAMTADGRPSDPALSHTAETVLKILGNRSLLINQIVPGNFSAMWEAIRPLMRPGVDTPANQQRLMDIVSLRDNIGEGMWFLYTAILVTSVVGFNLAARGCVKDPAAMKAEHDKYLAEQAQIQAASAAHSETVYAV